MKTLREHLGENAATGDNYYIANTYMLMLVGALESPLGPRRETVLADYLSYGEWQGVDKEPSVEGNYLLEGHYLNSDGEFPQAILPCWFHLPEREWECLDGYFKEPRRWMEIPWLPEVWEAAVADNAASKARSDAYYEAMQKKGF